MLAPAETSNITALFLSETILFSGVLEAQMDMRAKPTV